MKNDQSKVNGKGTEEFAPFGNPDGSRADIEDVLDGFISFSGSSLYGGLSTQSDDLTARVIVGRKGSGKTVYLRRFQAHSSIQDSLYADYIQQDLPTTENIIKFCHFYEECILTEKWMSLWRKAILRSVTSHLMHSKKLKEYIKVNEIKKIKDSYRSIIRDFGTPLSIYSQVIEIINMHDTSRKMTEYLENPLWEELESIISDIIQNCPPLCFYIDAVDEEFSHAPMYWHRCQKGLFYQTMRLLRDAKLGSRLHIVICIRDIVLSSVYRSEHRTRYYMEPHIRILNWSKDSIKFFLYEKIKMLNDKYFIGDLQNGKNINSWLGINRIKNKIRDIHEPIEDYILRHTRLLPRDIVTIGNSLCQELLKYKKFSKIYSLQEIIRETVSKVAKFFGDEQLIICGNQIASNYMPKRAVLNGYSDIYTAGKDFIRGMMDDAKSVITNIGKDRFSNSEFEKAKNITNELFGDDIDFFTILWQNGLIGYVNNYGDERKIIFYKEGTLEDFSIPLGKNEYVFHSCLIDSVGLKAVGKKPVEYS